MDDHFNSSDSDTSNGTVFRCDQAEAVLENEVPEIFTLREELASWASTNNCTRETVNEMLAILRRHGHPDPPKDSRTLLETNNRKTVTIAKCGGQYSYFSIERGLTNIISLRPSLFEAESHDLIELSFNIDGLPLFKSSSVQLWPILADFNGLAIFVVALYCGNSKPTSVSEYLEDFVSELKVLKENGFLYEGKRYRVVAKCFSCDAPARSFLKCIINHTGYNSCERCTVHGSWVGRIVFNSRDKFALRSNDTFVQFGYKEHQKGLSPLVDCGINFIRDFPLDYMHLVCLGVVKRILSFLKEGPKKCKLSLGQIHEISQKLTLLNGKLPSEFSRQPRSLNEVARWKATEFRQFLLYTGPLVLKSVVSSAVYRHFLALSLAISIMLDSDRAKRNSQIDYARKLLEYFVHSCKDIYGETFVVYNIHGLLHLHEDVINFQSSLDEISCFKYENYMQNFKKFVKKAQNPIVQVARRQSEIFAFSLKDKKSHLTPKISTRPRDSCFLLENGKFAIVREKQANSFLCDVIGMQHMKNIFREPAESKNFGIAFVTNIARASRKMLVPEDQLLRKVLFLPYNEGFALFPMLHDRERK